jgi:D-3-phosphoglycerate dehydrogenase / 2-oxoglutarate reductase
VKEVLDTIFGGDEPEASVGDELLDGPLRHDEEGITSSSETRWPFTLRFVAVRIASLSPYTEEVVRGLFADAEDVEVALVPPPPAPDAVRRAVADADLVLADKKHRHRLDRAILSAMNRCRLIQQPAVGFDAIDHIAAAELGIPVANAAGYNRDAVADWTVMAILNLVRHGARGDRAMRAGGWPQEAMRGRELGALTVGIVGLGNVGSAVATRVRAFGARVVFTDVVPRSLSGAAELPLDDLLAEADVVTVHVPLDRDTHHLIGDAQLGRMKPGAILVNASRGPVVDEVALVRALESGRLGGAGLDVYEVEPLAPDSPLRALDDVFLSPHAGAMTADAEAKLLEVCGANLRRVLSGLDPFNVVNGVTRRR